MTTAPRLPDFYRLTVADWLEMADEKRIVEIIGGEIFMAPPPAVRHQSIAKRLTVQLYRHVEEGGLGSIFFAPIGLKLKDDVVLEPDLMVVLNDKQDSIKEQYVEDADIVVEILSPGTAGRDVGVKREHYEGAGISEYWIVDPEASSIHVLTLDDGEYVTYGEFRGEGLLRSRRLSRLEISLQAIF